MKYKQLPYDQCGWLLCWIWQVTFCPALWPDQPGRWRHDQALTDYVMVALVLICVTFCLSMYPFELAARTSRKWKGWGMWQPAAQGEAMLRGLNRTIHQLLKSDICHGTHPHVLLQFIMFGVVLRVKILQGSRSRPAGLYTRLLRGHL